MADDGVAMIRILSDGSELATLSPLAPSSPAWQWVGMRRELSAFYRHLTVELTLVGSVSNQSVFFDDLCISFQTSKYCTGPKTRRSPTLLRTNDEH